MPQIKANVKSAFDPQSYKKLLKLRYMPAWLSLGLLALLAFIPNRLRDLLCIVLSYPAVMVPTRPRRIAYANLRTAFPDISAKECRRIVRRMMATGLTVFLAYAEPSVLPLALLRRRWKVVGGEYLQQAREQGQAIIFVAPHSLAIDRCGLYLSYAGLHMCTMVHQQKNPVYDWFLNAQRLRFGGAVYERSAGLRTIIRELKAGHSCFFLPDQDLGRENSRFVNFLGVPKATVTTLPKLAKAGNAAVMQLFSVYNFKTACFEVHFSPLFADYPSGDLQADLTYMNQVIEDMVRRYKEQYMWFLRFFKTRPDDSYPNIYENLHYSSFKKGRSLDYRGRRRPYQEPSAEEDSSSQGGCKPPQI